MKEALLKKLLETLSKRKGEQNGIGVQFPLQNAGRPCVPPVQNVFTIGTRRARYVPAPSLEERRKPVHVRNDGSGDFNPNTYA
jgi:hypothetical protein